MKLVPLFPDAETVEKRSRTRQALRVAGVAGGAVVVLSAGALIGVRELWPQARLSLSASQLATTQLAALGERVQSVSASSGGEPVKVALKHGVIVADQLLTPGARVKVELRVRRAGWIGWLVGDSTTVALTTRAPATYLKEQLVYAAKGKPVRLTFSAPVRVLSVKVTGEKRRVVTLPHARRTVSIGINDVGNHMAGTALVSATARTWEALPRAEHIDWFPAGPTPKVLVRPAPGSEITPSSALVLTFSRPVKDILGTEQPVLRSHTAGSWRQPNDHTLVFTPGGLGFTLGKPVALELPRALEVVSGDDPSSFRTLTWNVLGGSTLRLKQLLSNLGYLPFTWTPASGHDVPLVESAQARAAVEPPSGSFDWRFKKTPAALKALWSSASDRPVIIQGAIMAFESTHNLPLYPYATRTLWRAILEDNLAGKKATGGYSYVFVSESLPETLTLWHNGKVILRSPVNTGVSSRPTALGTFPVYLHLTSATMVGTNPDGSKYDDPGVPWVNYFKGGDAVHGFPRGSYGYPQSVGCVEAPIDTAGQIFPYVQVGTLVTVTA